MMSDGRESPQSECHHALAACLLLCIREDNWPELYHLDKIV